jgi:hypothetical protein
MLYTELTIGGKDYKFRLDAKACVSLEKKLGTNPFNIVTDMSREILPKITDIIAIFHCSLQRYEHGITEDKCYDLYDQLLEDGKNYTDILPILVEIFQTSGFFKAPETKEISGEETSKN